MFAGLGLLLLIVPLVELYVLIQVGQVIGVGWTILVLIAVSVAGTVLLKREGVAAWKRLQAALSDGRMPTDEVSDGFMILLGGALLLTPGFVTDVFGLMLLFPLTRAGAKVFLKKALGVALFRRFAGAATVATSGRKVYDAHVTGARRVDVPSSVPAQLPSEPPDPSDGVGSRGRGT